MNAPRICRPISVRIGMFCRFGSLLLEPAGCGHRLADLRVHAAGFRIDQRRQRVDVGALQLGEAAPVEDQTRQMSCCAAPAPRALPRRSRRPRRARSASAPAAAASRTGSRASCFGEPMLNSSPASAKICRLRSAISRSTATACEASDAHVNAHAGAFDLGEDRDQRQLEIAIDRSQFVARSSAGRRRAASCSTRSARSPA